MQRSRIGLALLALVLLASCLQGPLIQSFSASSEAVAKDTEVTLRWSASNYDTLTLTPSVGDVSGQTSATVYPSETTVYTLTASKGAAKESRTLEIRVGEAPVIRSFAPSVTPVEPGGTTRLSWIVENAETLRIDPEPGEVTGQTSATVTVQQDTTYTLTAANAFGETTATAAVKVGLGPTIKRFEADPEKLPEPGGETTLRWDVTGEGTVKVSINRGVGSGLDLTGSTTVNVSATTTYTLTASDDRGTRDARVTVSVGKPPVVTFDAAPSFISEGESSTLSWSVTGEDVTSVTIDQGIGAVEPEGSRLVSPETTTTYTLTASSPYGDIQKTATVTVAPPPPPGNITLLIAGQSNAVGEGELDAPESPISQVQMLGNDYVWKTAFEPLDDATGQIDTISKDDAPGHSFGVRLGKALYTETGKNIYLIPAAMGGSCVKPEPSCSYPSWQPTSNREDRNTLFGSAVYRAKVSAGERPNPSGEESGVGGPVTGIIWYQGESEGDAGSSTFIDNTNAVMNAFMDELGAPPVIYVQLGSRLEESAKDLGKNLGYQAIRELQRKMETGFGSEQRQAYYMVVTHDLPMIDKRHLSAEGQKILGERIARAYLEHVLQWPVDGTGPRLKSIDLVGPATIQVKTTQPINDDSSYEGYFTVFVDGSEKTLESGGIVKLGRDPSDDTAVLIELDADVGSSSVTVRYMPPDERPPGISCDPDCSAEEHDYTPPIPQRLDVIKNGDGLPLPAFGPLPVPFSSGS